MAYLCDFMRFGCLVLTPFSPPPSFRIPEPFFLLSYSLVAVFSLCFFQGCPGVSFLPHPVALGEKDAKKKGKVKSCEAVYILLTLPLACNM